MSIGAIYNRAVAGYSAESPAVKRQARSRDWTWGRSASGWRSRTCSGSPPRDSRLHRQNKRLDFAALAKVIKEYEVSEIVVGLPLRMSGEEGIQAEKMQRFAEELREKFKLPVHLWDERLTSAEAIGCSGKPRCRFRARGRWSIDGGRAHSAVVDGGKAVGLSGTVGVRSSASSHSSL